MRKSEPQPSWPMQPSTLIISVLLGVGLVMLVVFFSVSPRSFTMLRIGCCFLIPGLLIMAYRLLREPDTREKSN